jgi:hypothetical protein
MDDLLKSFEHAPSLAAIVVVIYLFLKFFKWLMVSHATRTSEFIETLNQVHTDNLDARKLSREVIESNTRETTKVNESLHRTNESVEEMTKVFREYLARAKNL